MTKCLTFHGRRRYSGTNRYFQKITAGVLGPTGGGRPRYRRARSACTASSRYFWELVRTHRKSLVMTGPRLARPFWAARAIGSLSAPIAGE